MGRPHEQRAECGKNRGGCLSPRVSGSENVEMARYVELRRHTDADGDVLTQEGVRAATEIGARLDGGYDLLVSTGAQRATQTLACFLVALGERVPSGVVVVAESGFSDRRQLDELDGAGVHAVLIGEALMRPADIEAAVRALTAPTM